MPRKKNTSEDAIVHIYEREDGNFVRFYLMYTLPGKGRVKELLKDIPKISRKDKHFPDARAKAQAYQWSRTEEIRNGMLGLSAHSDMWLHDWFSAVVEKIRSNESKNINRHTWSRLIEYTGRIVENWRRLKLSDVDKSVAKALIAYISTEYRDGSGKLQAPSTAEKKVNAFSLVMKEAVKEGLINRNPFAMLDKRDKIKVPPSTRAYLSVEEFERMKNTECLFTTTRNVYLFMCTCGLRISDVKALRWRDVDTDKDRWRLHIRMKKTQEPLFLPLSNAAKSFIPPKGDKSEEDLVFDDLPTEPAMNRQLKIWAIMAGIHKTITLHTARHTYATMLLTKGADIYTVSKLLGHSEVQTTQIYAKIVDKKKEEAVDLLNGLQ